MLSMDVVFTQILVILLYVLVGFAAGKLGLINPQQRKYLTRLCSDLILPFTILSATDQDVTLQQMTSMGLALLLLLLLFFLTTFLSVKVQTRLRVPQSVLVTTTSLVTYPNCTFLGLPLCSALFGEIAVLYNAMAVIAFNVLFFTWQYTLFTGKPFRPRNLIAVPTLTTFAMVLMLVLGLRFPAPVQTVISNVGAMITPLSLIIIGVMLSENQFRSILMEKRAYLVTLVRNLIVPLAGMCILAFMPMDAASRLCVLVFLACPCASLSTIYAIQYDMEPDYAARSALLSTLFFAATLPVILLLGMRFLQ